MGRFKRKGEGFWDTALKLGATAYGAKKLYGGVSKAYNKISNTVKKYNPITKYKQYKTNKENIQRMNAIDQKTNNIIKDIQDVKYGPLNKIKANDTSLSEAKRDKLNSYKTLINEGNLINNLKKEAIIKKNPLLKESAFELAKHLKETKPAELAALKKMHAFKQLVNSPEGKKQLINEAIELNKKDKNLNFINKIIKPNADLSKLVEDRVDKSRRKGGLFYIYGSKRYTDFDQRKNTQPSGFWKATSDLAEHQHDPIGGRIKKRGKGKKGKGKAWDHPSRGLFTPDDRGL